MALSMRRGREGPDRDEEEEEEEACRRAEQSGIHRAPKGAIGLNVEQEPPAGPGARAACSSCAGGRGGMVLELGKDL